jgi:hypothetical protein
VKGALLRRRGKFGRTARMAVDLQGAAVDLQGAAVGLTFGQVEARDYSARSELIAGPWGVDGQH